MRASIVCLFLIPSVSQAELIDLAHPTLPVIPGPLTGTFPLFGVWVEVTEPLRVDRVEVFGYVSSFPPGSQADFRAELYSTKAGFRDQLLVTGPIQTLSGTPGSPQKWLSFPLGGILEEGAKYELVIRGFQPPTPMLAEGFLTSGSSFPYQAGPFIVHGSSIGGGPTIAPIPHFRIEATPIPEPSTIILGLIGLLVSILMASRLLQRRPNRLSRGKVA